MATSKYPPRDDDGIIAAAKQIENSGVDPKDIGLDADDINRLATARQKGENSLTTHKQSQIKARADRAAKDDDVDAVADILSEFNRRSQPHPTTTDAMRELLGFPVYDKVKTVADAPTELPNVRIDAALPLNHYITFKERPEDAKGLEIHCKIGGNATGNVDDYNYLGTDTEPPYVKEFQPADGGKQAHYLFCWLNASKERGPWLMLSATVNTQSQTDTL